MSAARCAGITLPSAPQWAEMSAKAKASGKADEAACTEALQLAATLGLQGFLHRVDGVPAGFVLAQPPRPGVWVMRFAKGLDRFKGVLSR